MHSDWLRTVQHWIYFIYDSNVIVYVEDKEKFKYVSVTVDKIKKVEFLKLLLWFVSYVFVLALSTHWERMC